MHHYDCSECGVVGCFGECADKDLAEREYEEVQELKLSRARSLLSDELKRRSEMHDAREVLMDAGVYTPNEFDVLFD